MATLQQVVRDKYIAEFKRTQETIINGVPDWETYRYLSGYLRGMYDLMEIIYPLMRDPEGFNDDEEEGR